MPVHNLGKNERLKSRKLIALLFQKGQAIKSFPLILLWIETTSYPEVSSSPFLFSVSVPKRKFKRATDRNLVKRRIRESYRIQKTPYVDALVATKKQYAFMFIYTHKVISTFDTIDKAMSKALHRFNQSINL